MFGWFSPDADALVADADGFLPKRLYTSARDTEGKEKDNKAEEKNPQGCNRRMLLRRKIGAVADAFLGADVDAVPAMDALAVADLTDIHRAAVDAGVTVSAAVGVHFDAEDRHRMEERIDCAERADKTAERAETEYAQNQKKHKNQHLKCEESSEQGLQDFVPEHKREAGFEGAGGADVLTKPRRVLKERNGNNEQGKHNVLAVGKDTRHAVFLKLRRRDFVKQLLDKPDRAEKAADEPSEEEPEQQ